MSISTKSNLSNQLYTANLNTKGNMVNTSNNILFSCFTQGTDTDNYIIKVLRSNDNGITWADTNFPILGQYNHYTPYMAIDSSNIIHVVFSSYMSAGGSLRIYYSNSNNGGTTWSTPVSIQPLTGYDQTDPKIILDKKNNILNVVWTGTDATNGLTQIKHCKSLDNGVTWSYYKNVAPISAYAQTMPQVIVDTTGNIYVFWQGCDPTYTTKTQIKFTKSIDFGNSWLTYKNICIDANNSQTNFGIDIDSNGVLYAVWQQYDTTHTANYQIKACKSTNGGATWSSVVSVTDSTYDQYSPQIICNNTDINLFWFSYGDTTINRRLKYTKTTDFVTFTSHSYLTEPGDDINKFTLFKFNNYLLITYESYLAIYLKKFGYRKYLFQDGTDIKYSLATTGTITTTTLPISPDTITYNLNTIIQKYSLTVYDFNKAIASSLYTVTISTGDIVFTTTRSGPIIFTYNTSTQTNLTQTVSPQADGKTYKLGTAVLSGSVSAVEGAPILIDPSNYTVDYLNGIITFTTGKVNQVQFQYIPITRTWTTIGSIPVTTDMFTQYGHDELTWLTYTELNKLSSTNPYILFSDNGMEYNRPIAIVNGDSLSKYRYKVTMDGEINPLIDWTEYIIGDKSDFVTINSNKLVDSEPKNVIITLQQYDDGVIMTRKGTITLNNSAPTIFAQVNGTRLDLTVDDIDGDKVSYNIYSNGNKVYPIGSEYTTLLDSPSELKYIFKTDQINIDNDNIVIVNAKDQYGKSSMVRLDFIGEYVGLIFVDENGNRYSTDTGTPLRTLNMGTIQAGSQSNIFPVYLNNNNGFDVQNISIWGDGIITNGRVKFSKTLSPFVEEDVLEYQDILLNGSQILFYIRVDSDESTNPGGGDFRVLARAQVANADAQIQMPAPDPSATIIFNVTDDDGNPIQEASVNFNNNVIEKTNVLGKATYNNIPLDGDMNYTVSYNGYQNVNGIVNVSTTNETKTVNIVLSTLTTYNVKFNLLNNSTPIVGAKIKINGQSITIGDTTVTYNDINISTEYDGSTTINLVPGTYTYTVTANGYVDTNSTFTVDSTDITVNPTMAIAYKATFSITNGTNPVEYANVNINGKNITADYNGSAIINLGAGSYNYTITATGYQIKTGTITITSSDITTNIVLSV